MSQLPSAKNTAPSPAAGAVSDRSGFRGLNARAGGIGHNSRRNGRMYAIVFDFDTDTLQQLYPNSSWRNAYTDVRNYVTARGFEWKQGSTYFGGDTVDAVRCVRVVQRLSNKYPWFKASVRDIRMLRIEENNDLMIALDDQDD